MKKYKISLKLVVLCLILSFSLSILIKNRFIYNCCFNYQISKWSLLIRYAISVVTCILICLPLIKQYRYLHAFILRIISFLKRFMCENVSVLRNRLERITARIKQKVKIDRFLFTKLNNVRSVFFYVSLFVLFVTTFANEFKHVM